MNKNILNEILTYLFLVLLYIITINKRSYTMANYTEERVTTEKVVKLMAEKKDKWTREVVDTKFIRFLHIKQYVTLHNVITGDAIEFVISNRAKKIKMVQYLDIFPEPVESSITEKEFLSEYKRLMGIDYKE